MTSSLSNLVNNLFERIHRNRRKFLPDDEKFETFGIKCKCCDCFLKYKHFKDDLIEYKCLICNKNCQRKFDEKLKKRFFHAFKFSNHDYNNFILLLQEYVYPCEYMDNSEKFNETSLPNKDLEIKPLRVYHDLHVQNDRYRYAKANNK